MIILMGLAGSGKSTQGKILAEEMGGVWLSAGQVLRDTDNDEVHEIQRTGELVSDTVMIPLMAEALNQVTAEGKTAVLDGYPRTVSQADWMAENFAAEIEVVIWLDVPKDELVERLRLRGRADDKSAASIRERFRIIEQNICSVCAVLQSKNVKITKVNGVGTLDEVTARLHEVLKKVQNGEEIEIFRAECG